MYRWLYGINNEHHKRYERTYLVIIKLLIPLDAWHGAVLFFRKMDLSLDAPNYECSPNGGRRVHVLLRNVVMLSFVSNIYSLRLEYEYKVLMTIWCMSSLTYDDWEAHWKREGCVWVCAGLHLILTLRPSYPCRRHSHVVPHILKL
jgi:hypothetical protein